MFHGITSSWFRFAALVRIKVSKRQRYPEICSKMPFQNSILCPTVSSNVRSNSKLTFKLVWIPNFPSPALVEVLSITYYLPLSDWYMPSPRVFERCSLIQLSPTIPVSFSVPPFHDIKITLFWLISENKLSSHQVEFWLPGWQRKF